VGNIETRHGALDAFAHWSYGRRRWRRRALLVGGAGGCGEATQRPHQRSAIERHLEDVDVAARLEQRRLTSFGRTGTQAIRGANRDARAGVRLAQVARVGDVALGTWIAESSPAISSRIYNFFRYGTRPKPLTPIGANTRGTRQTEIDWFIVRGFECYGGISSGPGARITPSCCSRPKKSPSCAISTISPFEIRMLTVALMSTCLPVGGIRPKRR
jgi:hypothetical protein